jgi:putative oxygen-independent coproporphyrinogen III oxidase
MNDINRRLESLDAEKRELLGLLLRDEQPRGRTEIADGAGRAPAVAPGEPISAQDFFPVLARELAGESNRDLLIYVHVPFCSYKCAFCDWVADIPGGQLTSGPDARERYVEAVCRQIRYVGPRLTDLGYLPKFIYWGGGTPTRLDAEGHACIVEALQASFDLSTVQEHTMEASPETLTPEKLRMLKSFGVMRLSMGVQSFNAEELRRAGRGHTPEQAVAAVRMAHEAGIEQFNIDLIAALSEQTLAGLQYSLQAAVELQPTHITVYIYRPTTTTAMTRQVKRGVRSLGDVEHVERSYRLVKETLEAAGYEEYTMGYFAKSREFRCRGEEYYFNLQGDWIGFGSGAVSILGHHRLRNFHANLPRYLEDPLLFESCRDLRDHRQECAMYALRQAMLTEAGIQYDRFQRFFGHPFGELRKDPPIQGLIDYYQSCGAEFRETDRNFFLTPESRSRTYIAAWHGRQATVLDLDEDAAASGHGWSARRPSRGDGLPDIRESP